MTTESAPWPAEPVATSDEWEYSWETRQCVDIRCGAQQTFHGAVPQEELKRRFTEAGWRPAPYVGGHLCPAHARSPR